MSDFGSDKPVVGRSEFRLAHLEPPPIGAKIIMLSVYGTAFMGYWHAEYDVAAWAPYPDVPDEVKRYINERLSNEDTEEQSGAMGRS